MNSFYEHLLEGEPILFDLHTAASIGCEDDFENSEYKEINRQNKHGWTPLMYAVCCANFKVVLFLINSGANVNSRNFDGHSPLILAAKCGSTDIANLLINQGASINATDDKGWPALFHATAYGHRPVIQLLIDKGAIINLIEEKYGFTALMLASDYGHEIIVKDLLHYGADPTIVSKSGLLARSIAMKKGHLKVQNIIDEYMCTMKKYFKNIPKIPESQPPDLLYLLQSLQLDKYFTAFEAHEIDLDTFWTLSEEDLKEIGIHLLGPRKKILLAISRWYQNHTFSGNLEEQAYLNKLLQDNRKLQIQIKEMDSLINQKMCDRTSAKSHIHENIHLLKKYAENIQKTSIRLRFVQEQLKEISNKIKDNICHNIHERNQDDLKASQKDIISIFSLVDCIGKLVEDIQKQVKLIII